MKLIAQFIKEDSEVEFVRLTDGCLLISITDSGGSSYITLDEKEIQDLRHYLNLTDNVGLD